MEATTIKDFIRRFIKKMREVHEVAEKARAIGLSVGLSPKPANSPGAYPKKYIYCMTYPPSAKSTLSLTDVTQGRRSRRIGPANR